MILYSIPKPIKAFWGYLKFISIEHELINNVQNLHCTQLRVVSCFGLKCVFFVTVIF